MRVLGRYLAFFMLWLHYRVITPTGNLIAAAGMTLLSRCASQDVWLATLNKYAAGLGFQVQVVDPVASLADELLAAQKGAAHVRN